MEWRKQSLHGQYPLVQDQTNVNTEASNLWLCRCELFPETKTFIVAIQDKVIGSKNYQKYILRHNIDDKYRLCENPNETI